MSGKPTYQQQGLTRSNCQELTRLLQGLIRSDCQELTGILQGLACFSARFLHETFEKLAKPRDSYNILASILAGLYCHSCMILQDISSRWRRLGCLTSQKQHFQYMHCADEASCKSITYNRVSTKLHPLERSASPTQLLEKLRLHEMDVSVCNTVPRTSNGCYRYVHRYLSTVQ